MVSEAERTKLEGDADASNTVGLVLEDVVKRVRDELAAQGALARPLRATGAAELGVASAWGAQVRWRQRRHTSGGGCLLLKSARAGEALRCSASRFVEWVWQRLRTWCVPNGTGVALTVTWALPCCSAALCACATQKCGCSNEPQSHGPAHQPVRPRLSDETGRVP